MTTQPGLAPTAHAAGMYSGRVTTAPIVTQAAAAQVHTTGRAVNAAAGDLFHTAGVLGRTGGGSVADWMRVLAECAAPRARIEATQTLALAHVAAIDTVDGGTDDGSWLEQHQADACGHESVASCTRSIPWPSGPTPPTNLILPRRRHHRGSARAGPEWRCRPHAWPGGGVRANDEVGATPSGTDSGPSQRRPVTPLERSLAERLDLFDPGADRLDEVMIRAIAAAQHSQTARADSTFEMDTVSLTDCPIRWEFTGDWRAPDRDAAPPSCSRTSPAPPAPPEPPQSTRSGQTPRQWTSWGDDTCAEGEEPPF